VSLACFTNHLESLERDKESMIKSQATRAIKKDTKSCSLKSLITSLSEADQKIKEFEKKQETDAKRIVDLEYALSIQVDLHRYEVQGLDKNLDEVIENFNVEQTKREISDMERLRVQKNVEELRQTKEKCYKVAMECCNNLKNSFAKVGAFSSEQNFICGDPDGVIQWISGEAKAFEEILGDRGDFCAFASARGAVSVLEKVGCEHAKVVVQLGFPLSANDIRNPSAEAAALSGKFYSEVWLRGGREIADEAIRKNEKEPHDALEEARKTKEGAEPAKLIGISIVS
jgi:hypothetical protein